MTDYETFLKLYTTNDVPIDTGKEELELDDGTIENGYYISLVVPSDNRDKITGYSHFSTTIYFDKEGKFLFQSIWE